MNLAEITRTTQFAGDPNLAIGVRDRLRDVPSYDQFGKRVFDLIAAVIILPLILPVIIVCACLVARDGGHPFYSQLRVGRNGRAFRCWKIRSMVRNADVYLEHHLQANPDALLEWARDHKLSQDPRVTPLGRILRRTSLDELPQIFNVLRGDMSFVGPRPIVSEELGKYGIYKTGYLAMTPGITGLWQVSGRNDVSYHQRVALDMKYLARASFVLDLWIMLKTANAVLARTGK